MKFRKKPVVIEAVLVSDLIADYNNLLANCPDWAQLAWRGRPEIPGKTFFFRGDRDDVLIGVEVQTLEGRMFAAATDWLICGVAGEIYPCKPDIFAATYEAVED